jgi:hypothetical protein
MAWTRETATAACGLMGPKGSQARGYLQGLLGRDPNPKNESDTDGYEEAWLQGAEDRETHSPVVDNASIYRMMG